MTTAAFNATHARSDLQGLLDRYERMYESHLAACRANGATWTKRQEHIFEGQMNVLMDLIRELRGMAEQWDKGAGYFRVTEQMLGNDS
jgi:hypothetical protein